MIGPRHLHVSAALIPALFIMVVETAQGQEGGFQPLAGLDAYVEQLMADWYVPGLAVGVVRTGDGDSEYLRTFGYRDLERGLPVTSKTVFGIGSCAKAFTAAAVAILVSDGALGWNTPLVDSLPDFRLYDDYATRHATVMDLLLHRAGLDGYDVLKEIAVFGREGLWDKVQQLQPSHVCPVCGRFRYQMRYSNLSYQIAGRVVEEAAGESYEDFVRRRILEPTGMESTTLSYARARESGELAKPYLNYSLNSNPGFGGPYPSPAFAHQDPSYEGLIAPSGGVYSSLEAMVRWVRLHLDRGELGGTRVISEEAMRLMHTPLMGIRYSPDDPEEAYLSYGMGWFVQDYRGNYMVQHGGQVEGYMAMVSFLPFEGIGVVVLTNSYYHSVASIVSKNIYDRLLGLDAKERSAGDLEDYRTWVEAGLERMNAMWRTRPENAPSTHSIEAYTGEFRNPLYGTIAIREVGGELQAVFKEEFAVELRHFSYDTFATVSDLYDYNHLFFHFQLGADGKVDGVRVPLDGLGEDVLFRIVPGA